MSSTTPTKHKTNDATATATATTETATSTTATATSTTATTTNTNWQSTVPQQYRTDEISKIATALSNLEHKHTSIQSKLGLATRFENMIFMSATSLNDYHKKIQKRLKKLQKTYTSGGSSATAGKGGDGNNNVDNDISNIQEEINNKKFNLRLLYGDTMRLIAENGKLVSKMNPKLINHIDRFNECSFEVGAISSELAIKVGDGKPIVLKQRSPQDTLENLNHIQKSLEQKTTSLREWILKYAKEDVFFGEKLEEMEKTILLNTDNNYATLFYNALQEAIKQEGLSDVQNLSKEEITHKINVYQKRLKENVSIPRNKEDEKSASLTYVDKVRAASQICLLYTLISPDDQDTKIQLAGSLRSANDIIFEVTKHLEATYKPPESEKAVGEVSHNNVSLEDAWNKIMEYDVSLGENDKSGLIGDNDDVDSDSLPDSKRLKTSSGIQANTNNDKRLALRTKILFIGGRKPPSNLLDALHRKKAELCQSNEPYCVRYLKLQFGDAFEMLIYFSPLIVKMKAINTTNFSNTKRYQVMGVSGSLSLVGPLIAQQLQYASAHATRCLRRCFADSLRMNSSDFEVEILECNALLKFIGMARSTYYPNWTDVDVN